MLMVWRHHTEKLLHALWHTQIYHKIMETVNNDLFHNRSSKLHIVCSFQLLQQWPSTVATKHGNDVSIKPVPTTIECVKHGSRKNIWQHAHKLSAEVEPWPEMHLGIFWRPQNAPFCTYMPMLCVRQTVLHVTFGGKAKVWGAIAPAPT